MVVAIVQRMSVCGRPSQDGASHVRAAGDFCSEQMQDAGGGGERPCGSRQAVAIRSARTTLAVRCRAIDPGQNGCLLGVVIAVRIDVILGCCGDFRPKRGHTEGRQ